jgi:hypothetical protein
MRENIDNLKFTTLEEFRTSIFEKNKGKSSYPGNVTCTSVAGDFEYDRETNKLLFLTKEIIE